MAIKNLLLKLQPALLALLTLITLVCLARTENAFVSPWLPGPLAALTTWSGLTLTLAVALKLISPRHAPWLLASLILGMLMIGVGATASLVTLVFCGAIGATGQLFLRMVFRERATSWWEAMISGITIYVGAIGGLLHIAVNYRGTYLLLLSLPLLIYFYPAQRRAQSKTQLAACFSQIQAVLTTIPYWALTVALIIAGFIATFTFLPSVMHDDYTYHLAMWTQLESKHEYHFNTHIQRWSVAPFTLDSLHGFLSVIAGTDARGALVLQIYCLLIGVFWYMAGLLSTKATDKLLALVLFLSTPMLANLLQGLQTELLLALLTLIGAMLLAHRNLTFTSRSLSLFFICCLLCATKFPATIIAASFISILAISYRTDIKNQLKLRSLNTTVVSCLVIGSLVALHPYINAYLKTGNPIYPLFNNIFNQDSPISLASKSIFIGKPSAIAYTEFFFNSGKHFESANFIAGFQYFLLPLAGAIYCILFCSRLFSLVLCLPIALYGSAIFLEMQYWRYFFPLLPLASLLILILSANAKAAKNIQLLNKGAIIVYLLLNLFYLPGVSWLFHTNHLRLLDTSQRAEFEYQHSPESMANRYTNQNHPNATVLLAAGRPFGATLSGTPIYPASTAPEILYKMRDIDTPQALESFLISYQIDIVYLYENNSQPRFKFEPLLKELLDKYGTKEKTFGSISIYQLKLACTSDHPPCQN